MSRNTDSDPDIYGKGMANIYDALMKDIDYEMWSDYIDDVIQKFHLEARTILELACGTGSFAIFMDELDCYDITATDFSNVMIQKAKQKGKKINATVAFRQLDFRNINIDDTFDVVIMLFDSINYMMNDDDILLVFKEVKKILNKGGLFIFDFTTPSNSRKAVDLLNEEAVTKDGYHYVRESHYDDTAGIHYNEFEIEKRTDDGTDILEKYSEHHEERVYTLSHINHLVKKAGYLTLARFEDFDLREANENSDRITMVLQ